MDIKVNLIKLIAKSRFHWGRISIQKQLVILGLVCISGVVTFTAWVWVQRAQQQINDSINQFGLALAHALARGGAEALTNSGNLEGLRYYILTEKGHTPALVYVVYCDQNGNVLLDPNSKEDLKNVFPIYTQPLDKYSVPGVHKSPRGYRSITNFAVLMRRNNKDLGVCWVGLDNDTFTLLGTPKETNYFLFTIFGLVGILGALGVWVNYAIINKPLRTLAQGASEIAAGRFGHQITGTKAGKEIDELITAFNYMSSRLKLYDQHNVDSLMAERNKFNSERNKLELVLMSIADGVVVLDKDNKVQIVNQAALLLFDKQAQEMLGKPLVFCSEGPDAPMICQIVQAFTDSVTPSDKALEKNGEISESAIAVTEPMIQSIQLGERIVRLHSSPIFLKKEFIGSVMIMQDITKQIELERMKNEFMSNVSHELRTPITSIKSYVDTLCNHGDKLEADVYREFLQIIDNEADRLMHLVNDVLQLSRLEEADQELEMAPMDVRRAIEAAARAVNMMAKERDIDLIYPHSSDPGEVPIVNINQESMERVIINLLTNAIKYTPSGGNINVTVTVEPYKDKEGEELGVHVKDTGIGIPEDALANIFDRFFRVEKKVHTIKGTGLGLTIVKKIVEKHYGRVAATSAIGQGSTFSFYLPLATLPDEDEEGENDSDLDENSDVQIFDIKSGANTTT
ncbi:MAG: HAMP domain-containing protein [Cyanobacteria bacterium TGS_CYA1]|nr:HAMP domain-containing protein [Cyanobacteria bacterium TGS_CYA1]